MHMQVESKMRNGTTIAVFDSKDILIQDVQSALDLIMTAKERIFSNLVVVNKEAITEDFFKLSTGLAGEILQKFVNYRVKFAIYGDFSQYTSKPLKDFIYECNHGNDFYFAATKEEAVAMVGAPKHRDE